MDLSGSLLKDFAKAVNEPSSDKTVEEPYLRGTTKVVGDKKYVQIDGSSQLTPIVETVDVQEGDRVFVMIKNHKATVLGNFTYVPSARKEDEALEKAENAGEAASGAVNKSQEALDKANEAESAASDAKTHADDAKQSASEALEAANQAKTEVTEAKESATEANNKAQQAHEEALSAQENISSVNNKVDSMNAEVDKVKEDINSTLTDLGELAEETATIKNTMEVDYAKKTEVSTVEATLRSEISQSVGELQSTISETYAAKTELVTLEGKLQTQITQNADGIASQATKVEKLESDTVEMQGELNEAKQNAQNAQTAANDALSKANTAQENADSAAEAAETARKKADKASEDALNAAMDARVADEALTAARTALDEARAEYEAIASDPSSTPEDIANAQKAVDDAIVVVNEALEEAATAAYAANKAQEAADQAAIDAETAQGVANEAQNKANAAKEVADNAQAAADKAQQDVAALTQRVTTAETNISQNAEQIALTAQKTDEIGDLLQNNYYNKTQTDAAIKVSADSIKQEVSETHYTKTEVDEALADIDIGDIGGRNFVIGTSDAWSEWITPGSGSNVFQEIGSIDLARMGLKADDEITMQIELEGMGFTANTIFVSQGTVNEVSSGDNYFTNPWNNVVAISGDLEKLNTANKYVLTYKMPEASISKIESVGGICQLGFRCDNANEEAQYRYRRLKIESGGTVTDWTPAPEDSKDYTDSAIDESSQIITEQYRSLIEETSKQIELMVEQLKSVTDGHTTSISSISNQLQITSEMAQFVKTTTEQLQDAVDGKLSASEVQEWARFDGANLELGASNSPFKCTLSTTELAFYQGANKVAWISNNELNILTAIIAKSIGCGNFTFVDEGDLGFSLI